VKKWTAKQYRILRNILIILGIVAGLLIWAVAPAVFKNSAMLHAGNGPYGSKLALLPIIALPLFALIDGRKKQNIYTDNEEERARILEEIDRTVAHDQVFYAAAEDIAVILLMCLAFVIR